MNNWIGTFFIFPLFLYSCSKPKEQTNLKIELSGAEVIYHESITNYMNHFTEIAFFNEFEGIVISSYPAQILTTTDGGKTWVETFKGDAGSSLHELNLCNDGKGVCAFQKKTGRSHGRLLTTRNSGKEWTEKSSLGYFNYFELDCTNDSVLFYSGIGSGYDEPAQIFKSENFGNSWTESSMEGIPGSDNFYSQLQMIDGLNGIFIHPECRYTTTDGGLNWEYHAGNTYGLIDFYTPDKGVILESRIYPHYTLNRGTSWIESDFKSWNKFKGFYAARMVNEDLVFYAGSSGVWKSTDGGKSVEQINEMKEGDVFYSINYLHMVDEMTGYGIAWEYKTDSISTRTNHRVILETTTGWE